MDAVDELAHLGWVVGVVRMDRVAAVSCSSDDLGKAMKLSTSPVRSLGAAARDKPAVLVVDQLDAVSTYSGRMSDSFDSVEDTLNEARASSAGNIKIILVVRTVDLTADPRMSSLLTEKPRVATMEIADLSLDAVREALERGGVDTVGMRPVTLDLLRVPLHLSVFERLSEDARQMALRTLPELFERFTAQIRDAVEDGVSEDGWQRLVTSLVRYMSDNEVLQAPLAVIDSVPRRLVPTLTSAGALVEDGLSVGFFHETYFDFLFARAFVAQGRSLHEFLVESGQHLFRRAQTRQVLEYLAATDRRAFRETTIGLLSSGVIRTHLQYLTVSILRQLDASDQDWLAIEPLAFGDSPLAPHLAGLLSTPSWFDAADAAGRWESLLAFPDTVDAAAHQLIIAARERGARVSELVRPYVGLPGEWKARLRGMVQWSLRSDLVDLAIELIGNGTLDDVRGGLAVNSDFWTVLYGLVHDDDDRDLDGAARLIGAYLRRALIRAREDGAADPFRTDYLSDYSTAGGERTITTTALGAPATFVVEVLPFMIDVMVSTPEPGNDDQLRFVPRWSHRYQGSGHSIDGALFDGLDRALSAQAGCDLDTTIELIRTLAGSDYEPLRFLACRAFTAAGPAVSEEALDWLCRDPRNLHLGWADSSSWATRELIEAATRACDDQHLTALTDLLISFYPAWETTADGRAWRGRTQHILLSAIPTERRSQIVSRHTAELERKFAQYPIAGPKIMEAHWLGPPVRASAAKHMSDADWIRAINKHHDLRADWSGPTPVGGARELASLLGNYAQQEPERFAELAFSFTSDMAAAHIENIIHAVTGKIPVPMLSRLCEHAAAIAGESLGTTICHAVAEVAADADDAMIALLEHYAQDASPDCEPVERSSNPDPRPFGGDLPTAGMNCTRGAAARAIALVLFEQPHRAEGLLDSVERLANDPTLAVRTWAATAVTALFNTHGELAFELAEALVGDERIAVLDSENVVEMLTHAVLSAPDRFANHLNRALAGPDSVAEQAGHIWANAYGNDRLPTTVPADHTTFCPAARRGIAQTLATAPSVVPDVLATLFNDSDETVRAAASLAIQRLTDAPTPTAQEIVGAFTTSPAFDGHLDGTAPRLVDT
ncbi:hypothetical protein [Actinokineospora sp. NBRC 105648]|uniref:hypothetical protein n=1 Tax=Actinokineospora sp. NBRC 105648 TaxID=3032206 RepID=UPI002555B3D3|nr:hypothetical protein [Actinokineospora sp. NBRC 105648]